MTDWVEPYEGSSNGHKTLRLIQGERSDWTMFTTLLYPLCHRHCRQRQVTHHVSPCIASYDTLCTTKMAPLD